ncbi:MAG: hypothetical protein A2W91_08805 [Bacteroidetes bacterium GWF2_38_335]|nr:MAG: hypothetical protein A2W91_08805 [Bacteroidetes bacterium GWF2_38_335]OFY80473.1 MAG: hypothetical protein A2281_08530 [Bacteroidetes bacterium RIFOXYA12_FULL_38_20]HBS85919.1 hypothetical protein [Bacteroidales bacterium]
MKTIIAVLLFIAIQTSYSQSILVQPYIQDNQTTSVRIMWETDSGTESVVYAGDVDPDNAYTGVNYSGGTTSVVHEVLIDGLQPDTRYFYYAVTGSAVSDTFSFRTLPEGSANPVTRIIAISDCQYDSSEPGKLSETVNQGIINYCTNEFGSVNIEENIDQVLLVGDNVNTGLLISQWRDEFFANITNLGSRVSLLPVIGNHEGNASNYFTYFYLPQNGTPGFEEHWYYKDIANVRIIGFDSNTAYQNIIQLGWLSAVLEATGNDDNIDFVIFMEHHPELSEMWIAGETPFAGQVLDSLAAFSDATGKPSVFLFGHTHGYSRGQMKNSKVLQVNVATASGYLDLWGSTPQADYTDFNISFDEYGFMVIETTSGENPQMTIKRITRGDTEILYNNLLQDSVLLRPVIAENIPPACIFPIGGGDVHPDCIKLHVSPFESSGDEVGAVQFMVSKSYDFSTVIFDIWKHTENWYYDANTLDGDTLYKQEISGLDEFITYYWKARYRTQNLDWTEWSAVDSFNTVESLNTGNLITNPGAEDGINNWTVATGILESLTDGECAGTSPNSGTYYFGIGGLCTESAYAEAYQDVDVSMFAAQIDAGEDFANWGAYMSDYAYLDIPAIHVSFYDGDMNLLASTADIEGNTTSWTLYQETTAIPANTRTIRFTMSGTRNSGTDNDSYVDDIFLTVSTSEPDCWHYANNLSVEKVNETQFSIYPNPANDLLIVNSKGITEKSTIYLTDITGKTILKKAMNTDSSKIDISTINTGLYFVVVEREGERVFVGKVVVE